MAGLASVTPASGGGATGWTAAAVAALVLAVLLSDTGQGGDSEVFCLERVGIFGTVVSYTSQDELLRVDSAYVALDSADNYFSKGAYAAAASSWWFATGSNPEEESGVLTAHRPRPWTHHQSPLNPSAPVSCVLVLDDTAGWNGFDSATARFVGLLLYDE